MRQNAVAVFACAAFAVAHLLIADKIEVAGTKKLTIPQRVIAFFRDYKSEVKKIDYPKIQDSSARRILPYHFLKLQFSSTFYCSCEGKFVGIFEI